VNRFAKDIDYVDFSIPATFDSLLRQGFIIFGTIMIICVTNPIFIAIIIPIGCLYVLLQKFYVATSRQLRRMESSTRSPIYSWFGESVSGIATIKAYGLQEKFIDEIEKKVDENSKTMEPNFTTNRWLSIRLEMLGNLIILSAALLAVIGRDTLDPGMVGLSLSYAMQVTMNFNFLIRQSSQIENSMVSVERIMEYQSGLPQEAAWQLPADPPAAEWPSEGALSLRALSTRYREGLDLVLRDVSLEVAGGEKVGIVGRTGSGKSSLTLSLFR
jgi:ABC-type multidrug transport system fused ATPase/permease subunit